MQEPEDESVALPGAQLRAEQQQQQQQQEEPGATAAAAPLIRAPFVPRTWAIIESTLREGEQFANAFFDRPTKLRIARALDDFGVDYLELTSPAASEASAEDVRAIVGLGLKAKVRLFLVACCSCPC